MFDANDYQIGAKVTWRPQDPRWTRPTQTYGSIPPVGTQGNVIGHLTPVSFWPGNYGITVHWDTGDENYYPAIFCIPIPLTRLDGYIQEDHREYTTHKNQTNADRDTCFKCGKPTKMIDCGFSSSKLKYCSSCKI